MVPSWTGEMQRARACFLSARTKMSGQKTREMNQNIQKKIFFFREIDFISIHVFSKLNFLKDSDLL